MPALKFKKGKEQPVAQFVFLLFTGVATLLFFGWLCIPIFYAAYVLSSILINFAAKRK
jgi:hypothetical protein